MRTLIITPSADATTGWCSNPERLSLVRSGDTPSETSQVISDHWTALKHAWSHWLPAVEACLGQSFEIQTFFHAIPSWCSLTYFLVKIRAKPWGVILLPWRWKNEKTKTRSTPCTLEHTVCKKAAQISLNRSERKWWIHCIFSALYGRLLG